MYRVNTLRRLSAKSAGLRSVAGSLRSGSVSNVARFSTMPKTGARNSSSHLLVGGACAFTVGLIGYNSYFKSEKILLDDGKIEKTAEPVMEEVVVIEESVKEDIPVITATIEETAEKLGSTIEEISEEIEKEVENIANEITEELAEAQALEEKAEEESAAQNKGAYDPETGEINWDCPCLGGMAHGPCGEEFKTAFSCFVYSKEEPKGIDCIEKFSAMQNCFREHPEVYAEELRETEPFPEEDDKSKSAPSNEDASAKPVEESKPAAAEPVTEEVEPKKSKKSKKASKE